MIEVKPVEVEDKPVNNGAGLVCPNCGQPVKLVNTPDGKKYECTKKCGWDTDEFTL